MYDANDIRELFQDMHRQRVHRGNGTIELQGISFLANLESIFGEINEHYLDAEMEWYLMATRKVQPLFDIYGKKVEIWKNIADEHGRVNSNYGWCIFSSDRHRQYVTVRDTLRSDPYSRQAVMIYTTPEMHKIAGKDFTCTNVVQYFINDNRLDSVVQMRSNDIVFGYNYDRAWQQYILEMLARDLDLNPGNITWQVGSLHIYERHWHLL